jgi:hypothetical protein
VQRPGGPTAFVTGMKMHIDGCRLSKSIRHAYSTLMLAFFLFIIENTAHMPLKMSGIFKLNHFLLAYRSYIWYA